MAVADNVTVTVTGKAVNPDAKRHDPFATPKDKWQYITIPEKDIYDHPFGSLAINEHVFEAGMKHFVPPDIAKELQRLITTREAYLMQLLQPRKRAAVLAQVNKNSAGTVF